eukprot:COSAG01_NODE_25017_length_758_cov_1.213961_1_plen_48_part_10
MAETAGRRRCARRSTLNAQYEASCAERAELVARQQQVQEQGAAVAEEV